MLWRRINAQVGSSDVVKQLALGVRSAPFCSRKSQGVGYISRPPKKLLRMY
jgi:hypothetical protein